MAKAASFLVARESFAGELDGSPLEVREGDLADADSAIVQKYPSYFVAPRLRFPHEVEQATAAPGRKRGA